MFKNIIIAILVLIILAGAAYWYMYIREPIIDPPVTTFTPVIIETPVPTITPQPPLLF